MHTELVSIIIPVYNVEKYLERCVESVIDQSYENLEIILVDDGATDKSGFLCDELSKQDKRIVVLHKENGGLSSARNAGIDIAKGEYLYFLDSDDLIHPNTIEWMLEEINDDAITMVISNHVRFSEHEDIKWTVEKKASQVIEKEKAINCLLSNIPCEYELIMACARLMSKEIFGEIRFPLGKIHEDEFVAHKTILKSEKIVWLDIPLYGYMQRESSIVHQKNIKNTLDFLQAERIRLNELALLNKFDLTVLINKYLSDCIYIYVKYKNEINEIDKKRLLDDVWEIFCTSKKISTKNKIKVVLIKICPVVLLGRYLD